MNKFSKVWIVSLLAAMIFAACGGVPMPPHTGMFLELDGTFVELDRAYRSFADGSISPLPDYQVPNNKPTLVVYTPGESPSDLHMYRIEIRPVEEIPINIKPKGELVYVTPRRELASGRYIIGHGTGSIFEDSPVWGFVVGVLPVPGTRVVEEATPSPVIEGATPTPVPEVPVELWSIPDVAHYLMTDDAIYVTHENFNVCAYDRETGQLRWEMPDWDMESQPFGVGHGRVYLTREDNRIYALDAASAEVAWKYKLEEGENFARKDNLVLGEGFLFFETTNFITALDALTGEVKRMSVPPLTGDKILVYHGHAVVLRDRAWGRAFCYLWAPSGEIRRLHPKQHYPYFAEDTAVFHRQGKILYVLEAGPSIGSLGLRALDLTSPEFALIKDYNFENPRDSIVKNGTLFVWSSSEIIAIDPATAEEKWRRNYGGLGEITHVDENTIYIYSEDLSTLTAIDSTHGGIIWENDELPIERHARAYVASVGGIVVFAGKTDKGPILRGLDKETGQQIWKRPTKRIHLTPLQGNLMLVGGYELIDATTGELKWVAPKWIEDPIQEGDLLWGYMYHGIRLFKLPAEMVKEKKQPVKPRPTPTTADVEAIEAEIKQVIEAGNEAQLVSLKELTLDSVLEYWTGELLEEQREWIDDLKAKGQYAVAEPPVRFEYAEISLELDRSPPEATVTTIEEFKGILYYDRSTGALVKEGSPHTLKEWYHLRQEGGKWLIYRIEVERLD